MTAAFLTSGQASVGSYPNATNMPNSVDRSDGEQLLSNNCSSRCGESNFGSGANNLEMLHLEPQTGRP